jgi:LDH2 family malate/lactate/ureidoglycolate dehydrogenase
MTPSATTTPRFDHRALTAFAKNLLLKAGLNDDKATAVAEILIEGDLMGHTTHGLAQLGPYLGELEKGSMNKEGAPVVVSDFPAAVTWDGQRLPGPWLVLQAMELAAKRARTQGTCTVVIRRSHHIASLASFHKRATDQGLMMILTCSDFNNATVAPFGGLDAVFTPNPISVGIPTSGLPVVTDISCSATTNGLTNRLYAEGKKLPAPWVLDGHGNATDDPGALFREPKGTILPTGGLDSGHKGYGMTWMVEGLTGGLAGLGRADPKEGWGATVYLQIIDPAAFCGLAAFTRQTDKVATMCRASKPAKAGTTVRTPGERGLTMSADQAARGVALYPSILPTLVPWAEKLNVALPMPI